MKTKYQSTFKENIFFKEKPSELLLKIYRSDEKPIASDLSREIDSTYAHTVKVVERMEEENMIERKKKSRSKLIELTDKGEKIAEKLLEFEKVLTNVQ